MNAADAEIDRLRLSRGLSMDSAALAKLHDQIQAALRG